MENNLNNSVVAETLTLTGDLTIENAQELHQQLMTILDHTQQLTIVFENVTAADLSIVQLLCSAHRTSVRADKLLKLDHQRPEPLRQVVREVGFLRDKGCALDTQGSCIWKEGWS